MINEKEILKELDERIELQGIIVEHSYTDNRSGNAAYEQGRFDEIKALRDFIKTKSAQEAATSKGTDINSLTQETVYHKKSGMSEESDDNTKKVAAIAEKMIKALEIDFGKEEVNETNNEES